MINYKKLIVFVVTVPALLQAQFMILDQGHTVVSGPVANVVITYSDVYEKRDLDGSIISLDDQINREIVRQQVVVDKMPVDADAADKYLAGIQKTHSLTLDDLEDLAAQCGRILSEVKQLLTMKYTYDFFLYHKFRSRLVPTDQAVEDYCNEHPEVEPGYYAIQVAFVEYTDENKDEVRSNVDTMIAHPETMVTVSWSDPIKVDVDNIADDKSFIKNLEVGQIAVHDDNNVFELYKLVEKCDEHLVPVESRKAFVIDILNREMYENQLAKNLLLMREDVAIISLLD